MNMRIRTKWGQLIIDPERIYEIKVNINPWENIYKVEFIMEGTFQIIPAELPNANELAVLMRRISNEINFVKQFKYKDNAGQLQINEQKRMAAIRGRSKDE